METKKIAFSYMITLFLDWYKKENGKENIQDCYSAFSKLSLLKLLFLGTAIRVENNDPDLLDVFDNFSALPYGPVESDVYNWIIEDSIPHYTIGDRLIQIKDNNPIDIDNSLKLSINKSIDALKRVNPRLINADAFQLVEITHKWKSWSDAYSFAEFLGQRGYAMKIEEIKNDPYKYFG